MSDFSDSSQAPFSPQPSSPPPAFGAPAAPTPPPAYAPYPPVGGMPVQAPRPAVTVGASLLIAGGALCILGSFLNWFTVQGVDYNGFSGDDGQTKDGPVFLVLGLLLAGFGIAMIAAKRMLAVAILAVIIAAFAVLAALADIGDVADAMDLADALGVEASKGPGLWIILIGALVGLAGGIAALAKRRR